MRPERALSRCAVAACAMSAAALSACTSGSSTPSRTPAAVTSTAADAVAGYLDAVNRLCDDLLPKVIAVTGGGSLDVPVAQYRKQQPAHQVLLVAFDRDLAKISVPPAAAAKATVLRAYIRYANRLDAGRLRAARRGASAYADEIAAEKRASDDPSVTALTAAGFNPSCEAR